MDNYCDEEMWISGRLVPCALEKNHPGKCVWDEEVCECKRCYDPYLYGPYRKIGGKEI